MAGESNSPNMNLVLPGVGVTAGPTWASDVNASLTIIDGHNHSAGAGVQINPAGLNINADLTMASNNLTNIRSLRLAPQVAVLSSGTDIGCLYEVANDLYYNDGLGNQVRITQSGGVAGSPGSISGLASPASATYVGGSSTFVWQSAANTPANLDAASVVLRNLSASSFGLTLNPPASMAANYSLTLPALPASQKILTLDASGNLAPVYGVDSSVIFSAGVLGLAPGSVGSTQIGTGGVATANIAANAVTRPKLVAVGNVTSGEITSGGITSGSFIAISGLTCTLTTTGRPVMLILQGSAPGTAGSDGGGLVLVSASIATDFGAVIAVSADAGATYVSQWQFGGTITMGGTLAFPVGQAALYPVAAGTYTFQVYARILNNASTTQPQLKSVSLIAYEL